MGKAEYNFARVVWGSPKSVHYLITSLSIKIKLNTLRTGDANLRFYITTVQDG